MATLTRRLPHRVERAFGVTGRYLYSLEWTCPACEKTMRRTTDFGDIELEDDDEVLMTEECKTSKCSGRMSNLRAKVLAAESARPQANRDALQHQSGRDNPLFNGGDLIIGGEDA